MCVVNFKLDLLVFILLQVNNAIDVGSHEALEYCAYFFVHQNNILTIFIK